MTLELEMKDSRSELETKKWISVESLVKWLDFENSFDKKLENESEFHRGGVKARNRLKQDLLPRIEGFN